jgi:hypothetical protein
MDGAGLGAALAGASLLIDFGGNDTYEAKYFAQGAAAFGFGALLDLGGDDRYRIEAWGQGFGIGGGVGLLWDRAGNDRYLAGGVPDVFNRAGGLSGAQGAGFGHRGRLAGGIGILRDDAGDDAYEAQMFAQGLGYYYGLGLLWERGGNDQYRALQYAQGNGVHQALGVLREESGNDRYDLAVLYGQGMGLDVAFGALVDDAGDDEYRANDVAQGAATANGIGLLADQAGADRFTTGHGMHKWGYAEWRRGLPTVALLLHAPAAQFTPPFPGERSIAVEPMSPTVCPSQDPGEALLCRLKDAPDVDAIWRELRPLADSPLAGWLAARRARQLQRARARAARVADAAGGGSGTALELLPPAIRRRGSVRPAGRRVAGECKPAVVSAAIPAAGGHVLELVDDLHAARLGAVVALPRREAHLGADRQALEIVVLHAVAVEVHLPVVAQLAQEAVALLEQHLDDALVPAVIVLGVLFHLAAAQLGGLLQLALDRAEREVDQRRQLLRHVVDHFALLRRQVLVRRHARLHQHAVAIALVVRGLLLGERDAARSDAVRETLQPLHALEDVAFHPGGAIDGVEDEFRIGLHTRSNPRAGASSRERPLQRAVPRPCGA